jgi:hypothetical protein
MERDKVIFRIDRASGKVFALFPETPADSPNLCLTYANGQYGALGWRDCLRISRPAEFAEYKELAEELVQLGYNLVVVKREWPAMREIRRACVSLVERRL